jgi:Asp-tRNA(Asn)/Glu-tRNA(Gln) amidotransferase A subunit family amidase
MKQTILRIGIVALALALGFGAGYVLHTPSLNDEELYIRAARQLWGLDLTPAQIGLMADDLKENLQAYGAIRRENIPNALPPALEFHPRAAAPPSAPPPVKPERPAARPVTRPANLEELAFYPVTDLSELVRTRQVTSLELTELYLARLKRFDPTLHCVVTLTEALAREQARRADAEIAAGRWRGPLHGIPYGAKDLLTVPGYPATWGTAPYREQVLADTATVVRRLEAAGAVLVAKLTLGELAWGDVWFGGQTRNPWNPKDGSSGSSAGSASATAAGLVGFAIGTETWGSIVSPCTRCGATGLRPTFGRVSRAGAMALSWSMDKIGPIARSVDDCALVFDAIHGPDGLDPTVTDAPFRVPPRRPLDDLRIGYLKTLFEGDYPARKNNAASLETLRRLGARLVPVELPQGPIGSLAFILSAESAAAFDELTRSGGLEQMARQTRDSWPNVFRAARFVPAVEYLQANRLRTRLVADTNAIFDNIDVLVAPAFEGDTLLLTNLTGHPCVVVPDGLDAKGSPTSITFVGRLFDEAAILAAAATFQEAAPFSRKRPPGF